MPNHSFPGSLPGWPGLTGKEKFKFKWIFIERLHIAAHYLHFRCIFSSLLMAFFII